VVALKRSQLLFITGNRVGDAVLSTGILAHFLAERPGASVTVACGPLPAPLFADLPGLARIVPIVKAKRRRIGHWIALRHSLSGQKWDDVIDLRSAFFAWTVRAERRWVCRAEKRHEHRVEELARQLGVAPPPAPHLWLSPEREARVARLVDDRPLLAIGPTANWGGKRWPAERFAQLALALTGPGGMLEGARVMVLGATQERDSALPLLQACTDPLDWVGDHDLLDVFALLRHARMFIGNDSGLMHMAAAAGIPTLGLFGPSADWRYRPWAPLGAVVRTPESLEQLTSGVDYDYRSHRSLMTGLSVARVQDAALDLWRRARGDTL
jgi:ADP-heptose:LPS heptosyltransferase